MFAGFEVLTLDGLLRSFDFAANEFRFDRNALFHAETLQQLRHPLLGEDAHEVVFQRQIETRGARIALAACASAKLVVDSAGLVTLGAENVKAPRCDNLVMLLIRLSFVASQSLGPLVRRHSVFVTVVVKD